MTSLYTMYMEMECEYYMMSTLCIVNRFACVPNLTCSLLSLFSDVAAGARDHMNSRLMVMSSSMEEHLVQVKQNPSLHQHQSLNVSI